MKKLHALIAMLAVAPAFAAPKTVDLSVPKMDCAACFVTVNNAIKKVPGVSKALTDLDKRETHITYDDSKASPADLIKAARDVGFPATVAE